MNIIYVTCKDKKEAKKIAFSLVKNKLAICVNIIDRISSIYRWEGKIEETGETILIIKTKRELVDKAVRQINIIHSYKSPEIISWNIDKTPKSILQWMNEELK